MAKAYPITHYKVSERQYEFIQRLLADFNEDTKRLFKHILASNLRQAKYMGWTPLSYEFRIKHFPKSDWKALVLAEPQLIEVEEYDQYKGLSHAMHIVDMFMDQFLNAGIALYTPETIEAYAITPTVNLMTGKRVTARQKGSKKHNHQGNPEPDIVRRAMDAIPVSFCNEQLVGDYLNGLKAQIEAFAQLEQGEYTGGQKERMERLKLRWRNDKGYFDQVLKSDRQLSEWPGVIQYRPEWKGTATGRITGGMQSVTRQCKALVYQGIPNIRNYDLAASQTNIFKQELDAAGIECPWLERYLADGRFRKECAARCGMSYDGWKTAFYALLYGAEPEFEGGDFQRAIWEDVGQELFEPARDAVLATVAPLIEAIEQYGEYVMANVQAPQDEPFKVIRVKGDLYLRNACGKSRNINEIGEDYRKPEARRKKQIRTLMAHIIQGRESRFIHELTLLGSQYGFQVLSNEHDGLVVISKQGIPAEAVAIASERAGLHGLELEEKAFYKESDDPINPEDYDTFDALVAARLAAL